MKTLRSAFDVMNLSFLTQLQILEIDSQTWAETFGKLPLLEKVCLRVFEPRPFLEALVYKREAAEKSITAYCYVSFPKLHYIHLVGIDFQSDSPTILLDALLDCLMERYERNAEVQVLRLEDCYSLLPDEVERLEEVVVDVIWEGY